MDFAVYGSNYCEATPAPAGDFLTYTYASLDIPLYEAAALANQAERTQSTVAGWRGTSKAARGTLKPRAPALSRPINAAHSPYTVLMRYYKNAADRKARVTLGDFWPQFNPMGVVTQPSLVIPWVAKDCAKLQHGQLQVFDGAGQLIYWQALSGVNFTDGAHDDRGKFAAFVNANALQIQAANLPYRVQIQGHTGIFEDEGLALAAMQTEVRLFVPAAVGTNADALQDPQCLEFSSAEFYPLRSADSPDDDKPPAKGSYRWYKLKLAEAGYHPGPVHADARTTEMTAAVKEFQRTVPKLGGPPYHRIKADGARNSDTEKLLVNLAAPRQRPLLADTAFNTVALATAGPTLNATAQQMVAWVDDRHYHTDPGQIKLANEEMGLENYGGPMGLTDDDRVTTEEATVQRPWIPLKVALPLMTIADAQLNPAGNPVMRPEMLAATGPLRVDWTFREMDVDLTGINSGGYNADGNDWTRTRRFIRESIQTAAGGNNHGGAPCHNCPTTYGGIRDNAGMATDYREPFGRLEHSLYPWRAVEDIAPHTVCSLVHDDLGQAAKQVVPGLAGFAGIYLHPSRIAGDGYRFRAQVSFLPHPDNAQSHPNHKVLLRRYAKLPQAHTCEFRIWRKTSFRGFFDWTPGTGPAYANMIDAARPLYDPAFCRYVDEDPAQQILPGFNAPSRTDKSEYRKAVERGLARAVRSGTITKGFFPKKSKMTLNAQYFWPWGGEAHYGLPWRTSPTTWDGFNNWAMNTTKGKGTDQFYEDLLLWLMAKTEAASGVLCGHFLARYKAVPELWKRMYLCGANPAHQNVVPERTQAETRALNKKCSTAACNRNLVLAYIKYYDCGNGHTFTVFEAQANPDDYLGTACPDCAQPLAVNAVPLCSRVRPEQFRIRGAIGNQIHLPLRPQPGLG